MAIIRFKNPKTGKWETVIGTVVSQSRGRSKTYTMSQDSITAEIEKLEKEASVAGLSVVDLTKTLASILAHEELMVSDILSLVMNILHGDAYLDKVLTRNICIDGAQFVLKGIEAPGSAPAFAGQFYIDTKNKIAYIAVGNDSVSDWKSCTH